MTDVSLEDRLRRAFGDTCSRGIHGLPDGPLCQLRSHHQWRISKGRFGRQVTWSNLSRPFRYDDLSAEDFSQMTMENCQFDWADLRCAKFVGAVLKNVSFINCDLEDADFTNAQLEKVSFTECLDFDKAKFEGTAFFGPARSMTAPNAGDLCK